MKKIWIYGCAFLMWSCGAKSGGTSQAGSGSEEAKGQETTENTPGTPFARNPTAFSQDFYKGSDWMVPDTLSSSLLETPDDSSLKEYVPDSVSVKTVDGVEKSFYNGVLMNGAYRNLYFESTESFVSEPCFSVTVYKDGIKNDTVYHYSLHSKRMRCRFITLDSLHTLYQSYHATGHPHIFSQATRNKLDGVRQRWNSDGTPDWFEHYKDGKRHGEERRWYPNGYLWQINHYIEDEEVLPSETWYYDQAESRYHDPETAKEAPNRYEYKYSTAGEDDSYYIQEIYKLDKDGRKELLQREYFEKGADKPLYFMETPCDSVRREIVTVGSLKRLEIRNYSQGKLCLLESYPYGESRLPGVITETYSEGGVRTGKFMYDYNSKQMVPLRIYSSVGADVKKLEFSDYIALKEQNCNQELDAGKGHYTSNKEKLCIRWKKGELVLRNSSPETGQDNEVEYIEWFYDGYHPKYGLHFFHMTGYENWGYFVLSDATGEVFRYSAMSDAVFCGKSDLFLVAVVAPSEGECAIRVYKMFPEGHLAEVAVLQRGGAYFNDIDLQDFMWINETSFIASKKTSKEELNYDFYDGYTGNREEFEEQNYLSNEEEGWGYVRVDLHPDALKTENFIPASTEF